MAEESYPEVTWVPAVSLNALREASESVCSTFQGDPDSITMERYLAKFGISPADLDSFTTEIVEGYGEQHLKEDDDYHDKQNWGSVYLLGLLTGYLLAQKHPDD